MTFGVYSVDFAAYPFEVRIRSFDVVQQPFQVYKDATVAVGCGLTSAIVTLPLDLMG